ncbi:NHL repeat-containing protein [Paractinoplanes durhamensis]|uniref:Uncharacterized protein n=1 Tax=Paractinoplanes durhamensis TaxID=113563 RepID=A0ABQ3Z5Q5_9ACTN|nr:hypothetical protein [Actinoplanes durhamensis]GIE05162.1 hypothetical protein Adu01nite_65120 [Actinoplanes durhamensis]
MTRWTGAAAALVMVAGLLGGCGQAFRHDDCPGGPVDEVAHGQAPRMPAAADSVWVADGSGSVRAIDGRTGRATATATVAGTEPLIPPVLVTGGGRLWVYRTDTGTLAIIDPASGAVVGRATVEPVKPAAYQRIIHASGSLWIAQPGRLWRVGSAGKVTRTALPADFRPWAFAETGRLLWLGAGTRLLRIDPARPASFTEVALPDDIGELSYAGGLYATGINSPVVHRLDPDTGAVVGQVRLKHDEPALSLAGGWAIGNCGNVVRLPDGLTVRISDVSQDLPSVVALGDLWVGDEIASEIVRIDGATGKVRARLPVVAADPDDPAFALLAGRASVWVLDGGVSRVDADRVTRILPATIGVGLSAAAF